MENPENQTEKVPMKFCVEDNSEGGLTLVFRGRGQDLIDGLVSAMYAKEEVAALVLESLKRFEDIKTLNKIEALLEGKSKND